MHHWLSLVPSVAEIQWLLWLGPRASLVQGSLWTPAAHPAACQRPHWVESIHGPGQRSSMKRARRWVGQTQEQGRCIQ